MVQLGRKIGDEGVSTHSRLKAAGNDHSDYRIELKSFNTQPPEGGWSSVKAILTACSCFNTQPPEGGWGGDPTLKGGSRSFNTQPPEGGWLRRFA